MTGHVTSFFSAGSGREIPGSQSACVTHEDNGASPQGGPPFSPTPGAGIYSDLPEFPADSAPSPSSKELHGLVSEMWALALVMKHYEHIFA